MLLLVDTLHFAVRERDEKKVFDFLQLNICNFLFGHSPVQSYDFCYYFNGIRISFKDEGEYKCYVEFSGQGCRTYESLFRVDNKDNCDSNFWYNKLKYFCNVLDPEFRRIDIACDDHSGNFTVYDCIKYYAKGKFAGRAKKVVGKVFDERVFYVGSEKSNVLVRIYDKALERGYLEEDLGHAWLRVELQLRHGNARQLINEWLGSNNLQKYFTGHLIYFCRFLTKPNDKKNSQRINTAGFWKTFLHNAVSIPFVSTPGTDYNKSKLDRFLDNQCASSIKTKLLIDYNSDAKGFLLHYLRDNIRLNPSQIALVNSHIQHKFIFDDDAVVEEIPFDIKDDQLRLDIINSILRSAGCDLISLDDLNSTDDHIEQLDFWEVLRSE